MQERYKLVEQLKKELRQKLKLSMKDESKNREITQKLIVQGMLRMMERNISVQSPASQSKLIQSLFPTCQKQFEEIFKR